MKKINIAELLKDYPHGMKLYSPIFGDVYLDEFRPHLAVVVRTSDKQREEFLYDGRFGINGECMLFPSKENRDWRTFQRPFKDGDILVNVLTRQPFIFKKLNNSSGCYSYCGIDSFGQFKLGSDDWTPVNSLGFATEEEKQKLFDAIKVVGFIWDPEKKTLKKLIVRKLQDDLGLVSNKFDINTLKPFESRVLVRNVGAWSPALWGYYAKECGHPFVVVGGNIFAECVPYEGNEHLLDTTDDCDEYYKTWE